MFAASNDAGRDRDITMTASGGTNGSIHRLDRRRFLLAGAAGWAGLALPHGTRAQATPEPSTIPVELAREAEALAARIPVGDPTGDVTLVEFFDYNCGYCKASARELDAFLAADRDVKYVLVHLAVLGLPSVLAHKVALGALVTQGPEKAYALHKRLFALSGVVDGDRALREAQALGFNRQALTDAANDSRIAEMLTASATLADNLGLVATPSLVVGPQAYQGFVSLSAKRAIAARVRG